MQISIKGSLSAINFDFGRRKKVFYMEFIDKTLGEMLEHWAEVSPNRDFMVYSDRGLRYTYSQFNERVDNLAKGLYSLGVKKGTNVGIWATNVPEWLTMLFASAKLGAIAVTVNTNYKASELAYIMKNSDLHTLALIEGFRDNDYIDTVNRLLPELKSQPKGELHSEEFPEFRNVIFMGEQNHDGIFGIEELIERGKGMDSQILRDIAKTFNCHDQVNMQYTSGTTGFPKGVMLTHHNILNNGFATGEFMHYTPEDKLLTCVPLFHCFGCVLALCAVITHGSTMVMIEEFDALKVLESIDKEQCTILYGVPTMFIAELNHPLFDLFDMSSLRTGIMAGAVCPIETMNQVMNKMNCQVISVYGLTESSPGMTATRFTDSVEVRATTVGRPYPHVEVKVLDPITGEECAVGVQGEMCCRGYNIMKGYYKNPEATAECIDKNGFLHSGDLGMMDEEGNFSITGRIKEMIIRGGENIYPREIENFLLTMPQVKDVQVVGLPSPRYGEAVGAFIIRKEGFNIDEEQVKEFCLGDMARYKIPKYILFVDTFPMTASGKIQKYRLRDMGTEMLSQQGVRIV